MEKYGVGKGVLRLMTLVILGGALTILGCDDGGGGNFTAITAANFQANVAHRSFPIDGGSIDPDFAGLNGTLTIGPLNIDSNSDGNPDTAAFTLTLDGTVLGGTVTVGNSCAITSLFIDAEEDDLMVFDPPVTDLADPCETNENDGSLRLVVDGEEFLSGPATAIGDTPIFNLNVALSPDYEVAPATPLDNRSETGTANLRLLPNNILEYTITVNNLTPADTLTNAHIHPGGVIENGGVLITLVNQPVQLGRTANIVFPAPTNGTVSVSGSIPLTFDEAAQLSDAANPFYVNVHSQQVGAGLVRGQLRQNIVLAFNPLLSPANEVPPIEGRPETGMATIRLLDTNALAFNLTVFDLQEGDALTNAHIHSGNSDEAGDIFITLVGQPDQEGQEGRQAGIDFVGSNGILEASGVITATLTEVTSLTNINNPFYVNIHSQQEGGGLLRGQLRDVFLENQPPTANAGPDQTVTLETGQTAVDVTLDGSGSSDPDGTIAAYTWTGTPNPDDFAMPTVTLGAGAHTFTLVVTDNEGADSAPDTVVITVQEQATLDGAQLYADNCSTCHGTDGSGTTIAVNIQGASDENIQDAINAVPLMASLSSLTPEEIEAIAGFLAQQAPLVSFANDIQPIFTANCAKVGCHVGTSPQAGLNLAAGQAYSNLVNVLSSEVPSLARVEPGDPDQSYLYLKHSGAAGIVGLRMPFDNPNFFVDNPDLLELEEEWIRQGALNN